MDVKNILNHHRFIPVYDRSFITLTCILLFEAYIYQSCCLFETFGLELRLENPVQPEWESIISLLQPGRVEYLPIGKKESGMVELKQVPSIVPAFRKEKVNKDIMFQCKQCDTDAKRTPRFQVDSFDIVQCDKCHHRFADLQTGSDHAKTVYSDEYFEGGKAGYPDYLKQSEMLIARGRYYADLVSRYVQPGELLDVGAAAGFLLKGFLDAGWNGMGVEPNEAMARYAREELNVLVTSAPMEELKIEKQFDLVSMIQVLPHFYDLMTALKTMSDLTKPGGYWLIETWNVNSLTAKIMGKSWHEYVPPSVLHWFSPQTVEFFARQFAMEKIAMGRPVKKISGAHAKSLIRHKLEGNLLRTTIAPLLGFIPDKAYFPYPAEDLFWILLRRLPA